MEAGLTIHEGVSLIKYVHVVIKMICLKCENVKKAFTLRYFVASEKFPIKYQKP